MSAEHVLYSTIKLRMFTTAMTCEKYAVLVICSFSPCLQLECTAITIVVQQKYTHAYSTHTHTRIQPLWVVQCTGASRIHLQYGPVITKPINEPTVALDLT